MGNDNCTVGDVCPTELFPTNRRKIFSEDRLEQEEMLKRIE